MTEFEPDLPVERTQAREPDGGSAQECGAATGGRSRRVRPNAQVQDLPAGHPAHQERGADLVGSVPAVAFYAAGSHHLTLENSCHLSLKVTAKPVGCGFTYRQQTCHLLARFDRHPPASPCNQRGHTHDNYTQPANNCCRCNPS